MDINSSEQGVASGTVPGLPSDRELLELAAKAAGMNLEERWFWQAIHDTEWGLYANNANGTQQQWNPLTDDGDALRLAVKLRLLIDVEEGGRTYVSAEIPSLAEQHGSDPYAATRRAIVRAAAAIAKLRSRLSHEGETR